MLAAIPASAAANTDTRIIVKREPGLTAAERADIRADADVRLVRTLSLPRTEVVATTDARDALATLRRDPDVVYAELDRIRTAVQTTPQPDPYMGLLWALDSGTDPDINGVQAWWFATGAGQTIAVVDSGVNKDHPDFLDAALDSKVTSGYSFVAPRGPDDYSDLDPDSHGTHVTGTIAARRENGVGIAGVAPDTEIMALRALTVDANGNVTGRDSDIAEAFRYAGAAGVPIVNASLGAPGASQTLRDAIAASPRTLFVVGASNEGRDNDTNPIYPCNTPEPNVLCVGASTHVDAVLSESNFGEQSVDVFAPGEAIYSTLRDGQYDYKWGTSVATPHVSGTAALVREELGDVGPKVLKELLLASVHEEPAFVESVSGGRLDAAAAINLALAGTPLDDGDGDGWADAADACPAGSSQDTYDGCPVDHDRDGIPDETDNCDLKPSSDQTDLDGDGLGAPCDSTPRGHNNDGDAFWQIDDACPDVYGTLSNGCPAPPPDPTPSPTPPPPNSDGDDRYDANDACPAEYAISNDGCPLPRVTSLSGRVRKRGTRRSVTVKVATTRVAVVQMTIERRRGSRWVRVKRRTTTTAGNRASISASRLMLGRYRVVVALSSGAGKVAPVSTGFRVR